MKSTGNPSVSTQTKIIAGKKVKVASSAYVRQSSNKVKEQYAGALKNLKNR